MHFRVLASMLAIAMAPLAAPSGAQTAPAPVQVMVLGEFPMALNAERDLHNLEVDDMLSPRRQAQIAAVTRGLARFRPTKVAVEGDADEAAPLYQKYLAGALPPSREEIVQLGFRTARLAGAGVFGIDADGDFPYPPLKSYADAHGQSGLLDAQNGILERRVAIEQSILTRRGVAALLRELNDPARLAGDNGFYRTTLRIGAGDAQPGVDLLTAWYHRNFLICANLVQLAKPGDRILVVFGAGHAFLLRQCVSETPGFKLVEPNDYLPG